MDNLTIKQLLKVAKANLAEARAEFDRINKSHQDYDEASECEWEDLLEEAGNETYACECIVRFLNAHLNHKTNN